MTKVFVYGSLREGLGNHALLENSVKLGEFRLELPYAMYSLGGYPALVVDEAVNLITGEVYEIDQPTFERLDWLEGYPRYYDRTLIDTPLGQAWMYFINENTYQIRVESGDWKEFYNGKHQQG